MSSNERVKPRHGLRILFSENAWTALCAMQKEIGHKYKTEVIQDALVLLHDLLNGKKPSITLNCVILGEHVSKNTVFLRLSAGVSVEQEKKEWSRKGGTSFKSFESFLVERGAIKIPIKFSDG